jgi:ribonuclease HI
MQIVTIYTDGACSGNPGAGGWGAYLQYGNKTKEIFGGEEQTTNNRMEMMAAIKALQILKRECVIEIYTDSIYLKDGITKWIFEWQKNNWANAIKKKIKNLDLWQELQSQVASHKVTWHWVKGHSGNVGNEIADGLAVKGCEQIKSKILACSK